MILPEFCGGESGPPHAFLSSFPSSLHGNPIKLIGQVPVLVRASLYCKSFRCDAEPSTQALLQAVFVAVFLKRYNGFSWTVQGFGVAGPLECGLAIRPAVFENKQSKLELFDGVGSLRFVHRSIHPGSSARGLTPAFGLCT